MDLETARIEYFQALMAGQRYDAQAVVERLLETGHSPVEILQRVIVWGQAEVGEAWQRARATVSQEHRASAITESVLQSLIDEVSMIPGAARPGEAGRAVIASSEGEWHLLPARFAEAILLLRGFDVHFIGPSVPADDLREFLEPDVPAAVAVSCMMPTSLVGAWRTISVLRELGTRVVGGGRGFGPEGRWGRRIGTDLVAADFVQGADFIAGAQGKPLLPPREPAGDPAVLAEIERAEDIEPEVVQTVCYHLRGRPAFAEHPKLMRRVADEVAGAWRTLLAATLVEDHQLVDDYVAWLDGVLAARDLPRSFVEAVFGELADNLPAGFPHTSAAAAAALASSQRVTAA